MKDHRRRPTPILVALGDIRSTVLIDVNGDEVFIEQRANILVFVSDGVHLMARIAPPRLQRQDDELVLALGLSEYVVSPFAPRHGGINERCGGKR